MSQFNPEQSNPEQSIRDHANLDKWHQVVANKDMKLLRELLDDNVEFHSPTVWQPKVGRDITQYILKMVIDIFQDFEYQREWIDDKNFALE